jgi:tape measure domain-containing protein
VGLGLVGKLYYEIEAHSAKFDNSIDASKKKAQEFENSWKQTAQGLSDTGGKMTAFLTLPILGIGAAMLKGASDMENYQTSFTTLLNSGEKATAMLADLKKFAAVTPFGFADLAKSSQTLLGFGQSASSVMPTIKMLGDVAMGNKDKFQQLSLVYAQIMSTGKLMGQDLLQLINAGFNPLTIMAEKTGKSVSQLKDEMAKGAISADMVAESFKTATSEGGLFFGGMEKASKTLSGQWSTVMDDISNLGNQFGEILIPIAKDVIKWISGLVATFTSLDDGTKRMILTIGGIILISGPVISAIGGIMTAATAFNPVVLGITVGVIALVAGLTYLISSMKDTSKEWKSMDETVQKNAKSIDEFKKSLVGIDFGTLSVAQLKKGVTDAQAEIVKLQETMKTPVKGDGKFVLSIGTDEALQTKKNNDELERRTKIQERINALQADIAVATEEINKKQEAGKVVLEQVSAANQKLRDEFKEASRLDVENEIAGIEKKKAEYIKAGVNKVDVEKWASAQIDNIISESIAESEKKEAEAEEKRKERLIKSASDIAQGYIQVFSAMAPVFSAIGTALVKQGDAWKDVGKAGILAIAGIIKALGDQLSAMAAAKLIEAIATSIEAIANPLLIPTAMAQYGSAAVLGGGAAAAWIASGALQGWAGSFAQSGTVMPSPGGSLARVAEGGEREHIMGDALFRQVIREELQAMTQPVINVSGEIDGKVLLSFIAQAARNGDLSINERAIVK